MSFTTELQSQLQAQLQAQTVAPVPATTPVASTSATNTPTTSIPATSIRANTTVATTPTTRTDTSLASRNFDTSPAPFLAGAWAPTPVEPVALEARAATLTTRSLKTSTKLDALRLAVNCLDLTTLEGRDTPARVQSLCVKAIQPDPTNLDIPSVAAVCVYPELVQSAVSALHGSQVKVASVAGSFPAGLGPLTARLEEIKWVVQQGASEVDIVLNRGAFLSGDYTKAFDDIAQSKQAAGNAHLKVILEVGELGSYDNIRRASMLAAAAGADFIKTSTGYISSGATFPVALCMAEAIRDIAQRTGQQVGLKLSGGIRSAKQAWHYLVIVAETLGEPWQSPQLFRLGASSLLNDILMQYAKLATGRYQRPEDFTLA